MLKLSEFRVLYPQYNDMTDFEVTQKMHATQYSAMPYESFAASFGGPLQEDKAEVAARQYNAANPNHPITAQDIRNKDRSGWWGGIRLLGEGIYDAITDQFPEDMARVWRGGDIDPTDPGIADSIIKRQVKDSAARIPSLQEAEGDILANSLYQGPKSVATSMATGIAGGVLGGGAGAAAGSLVPGVGTAAGGLAGSMFGGATMSGAAFYRMAKDQFVDEVQQAMQASMGRTLTREEAAELNKAIDADATEFGLWEAGPEAVSQFFTLGLIKGVGGIALKKFGLGAMADAIGKRALTRIPAKLAAELGEEETTEGITYFGQEGIRQRYGLRPDAPTIGEFVKEQAGPVAVGSVLQLGGMRGARYLGDRMRRRAEDVSAAGKDDGATPPPPSGSQLLSEQDIAPAAPYVFEQSPDNMPVPVSPGEFISEADAADIDAFVRDYEEREQIQEDASILSEYGRSQTARFTPVQLALEAGKPVDLLGLPQDASGLARGIGGLALPFGTEAIPAGTRDTGRGPIAPPTDFAGTPVATPFMPRPALPQQAGPSAGLGRWAGGRSQLAYGGGMMQGLGFMGEQESSPTSAMPTASRITNTQFAPRADTTDMADALGMPAPSPLAPEIQAAPSPMPQVPALQNADMEQQPSAHVETVQPAPPPGYNYYLPSFVTAQYGRSKTKAAKESPAPAPQNGQDATAPRENRTDLLRQLPPESRKEARRLTNAQLRERVRAEQNPVKFDRDAIDYTVEDYPMPTAPSGTVFTSASGRRLSPFPQVDYSTSRKHKASNAKVAAWLLDEARKEAAPNEWRSLLMRGMRTDNLSPADVRELVDILSSGVEEEKSPRLLKSPSWESAHERKAQEEARDEKVAEPQSDASEAENAVVKSKKTPEEVSDGRGSKRNDVASLRQPVVEEQAAVASGERPGSGDGAVEQPEPRSTEEASRHDGGKRRGTGDLDGGHVGRRDNGNDSGGILPDDGLPGRGTSRGTSDGNSGVGGEGARGGSRDGRGVRGDGRRVGGESQPLAKGPANQNNHRIADDDTIVPGGSVARAKANIAAIRLVKKLDEANRPATPEEKKILTQFTGWGSLAQTVFNPEHVRTARSEVLAKERGWGHPLAYASEADKEKYAKWKSRYGEVLMPELGGLLTEKEWAAAEKSTLNAHYTDRKVISAMWKMAERLGFQGGRVLEPSAGTGLFFGLMPEAISQKSSLVGVELDEMTGKILKYLYPDADIQITGFEKSKRLGDNSVDLVISNVPFGDFQVFDKARPQYSKQSIHNYFFSRAIDTVRPGGLVMQITSHFTLDSGSAARLREDWGRKADLVAAVRLPGTAFEKNAGTEVTTDIIVFRKKSDSDFSLGQPFRNLAAVQTKQGATQVNEYFVAHQEMVLGEHSLSGSMYGGNEYTLLPNKSESLEAGLGRIAETLPADVYGIDAASGPVVELLGKDAQEGAKEGTLVEDGGSVYIVTDGRLEKPEWAGKPRQVEQAKAYIGVKDAALQLISAMNTDDGDTRVNELRKALNEKYDAYVKKHGSINKSGNSFLEDDIEFPTMAALENVTEIVSQKPVKNGPQKGTTRPAKEKQISKADIFTKRTIFPFHAPVHANNAEDAVKISRIYKNKIDLPYVASLLGMDTEQAKQILLESKEVFENPETGLLEPRDVYLSGNVREKLHRAEMAEEENLDYASNVTALREVQPERIGIDSIYATIGSSWLPPNVYEGFLHHIGVRSVQVTRMRLPGDEGGTNWSVQGAGLSADARNKWGTDRASVVDIVEDCLNLKRVVVMDTFKEDGKTKSIRNEAETLAAQEKQRLLQEEFAQWIKGSEFVQEIEDIYNETFNGSVVRHFDVPDIKHYPGASHSIELRDNQKKGVSRALQESCLLAHGVGSGKTMLQITLAMEMRRLGTAKKPWIVVQGATLAQFAASFKRLYPGARILAPSENQRNAKNRRRLLAQIASGDWDAVITPHGFFNGVSVSPETEIRFISEQIAEYEDLLGGTDKSDKITRKQIEKKIERLKLRLEKLADTRKDENIYFDALGIDALIIDEAHAYKRGQFVTKMDNVKGLDRDSSQRSMQLLMKARMVQAKTGGKNVVLATGTPISNTLTEMWTMFRYTRPDLLQQFGVEQFDDFATTFAATSVTQEETATGEWKDVERFNKYVNGPELLTLWRLGADVAITEDLTSIKNMPNLKEGKIHEVSVERSEALSNYIESLRQERIDWDNLTGKEKRAQSHVPLTIYGRAKQAAIDLRLVDSTLEDEPNSKANTAVRNIFERWEKYKDTSATQIVFSDTFQSRDKSFNLFKDIKNKLIALGVPANEIAIIHDYKTDEARKKLFDSVVQGDVRVLMGTTEKLGVGVNVQDRLVTAHHLDAPQRPMDFEQRNGRIRRPGNMFQEVEILTYGTKNTLDSVTFQQLISKQKFINQLLRGNVSDRSFENPFDATQATFEDMMAAFSGNPLAKEKMQLTAEVRRLKAQLASHNSQISNQRFKLRSMRSRLEQQRESLPREKAVTDFVKRNYPDGTIENRKEIAKQINDWLTPAIKTITGFLNEIKTEAQWYVKDKKTHIQSTSIDIGNGVSIDIKLAPEMRFPNQINEEIERVVISEYTLNGPHGIKQTDGFNSAQGLLTRLSNVFTQLQSSEKLAEARIKDSEAQIASLEKEIARPFAQQKELDEAVKRLGEVEKELEETTKVKDEAAQTKDEEPLASILPGQYLSPSRNTRLRLRPIAVQRVADSLGKIAKNAAPVRVVQHFEELPESIKGKYVGNVSTLEGVYDPRSRAVWLVADNLSDAGRVAEVWAHEQIVHHGLRGLLSDAERKTVLSQSWISMGGMKNATIREIADKYDLNPRSDLKARETVMEEVLAHLAEKRRAGSLDTTEQSAWRKLVNAVLRAWNKLVQVVSGREARMDYRGVDALLAELGRYVMEGKEAARGAQEGTALAAMRNLTEGADAPLASLSARDILGMTVRRTTRAAETPEIRHLFKKDDLTMLQSIVQLPHWIAKQAPAFAKVYERQLKRMDERSAALKKSLETVPSMFGKDRLKTGDMDSLRNLLWEHEGKEVTELEGVEKFLTEETLATGREIIKVNPEFYDAYQRWLDGLHGTKAAKAAMLEIRKSLDADLVLAHNRMAAMAEMSDDAIKQFRQSIGHVPNYFPHHRYGAYFVQAKVGDDVVFRQHFDALGEKAAMAAARKLVEEQRKNYPDAEWSDGKNDRLPDEVLGAPIDSEAMEQIIRAATAKIGDKERATEINELLTEGVADVLKTRGWGSHGIQRKGIPGFETEDIARVLYDYKAGLNGWLTKMEAARDFSEALSDIDARQTPNLWKYTSQYVKDMLRNSDRVDRITGNIKTAAFAWYLGGSIKTALVNATQNLVVGVPRLQMDVMGGGPEWLAGVQSALVDRVTGNKGKGLTDEEARLVQELYGESVITDAFMEEVRGQLRGISGATLWNKFTKVLGLPMSEVERFNRASLALAAFRAARSGKLKAKAREKYGVKGKASYEQAKAFASDVVRDAHFVYGKSNMPEFMRSNTAGRAMASMYTFRTFTHNMVAMWLWALKTQGKDGAAFVAKSLGATMALGGVTALPLYATLMALFQAVTGDDDDWTEQIRKHLPESNLLRDMVCYGAPAIAGVNIGGSLKMETPLTKGLTKGKTPQEVLTDSIGDIIGIPYDLLVVKPSRVLEAHSKGNTWRMLEEAAPVAVKNGMQAWRLYSEGQTTMSGRPINAPGEKGARRLNAGESFGKLLGFQPVSSTKSYDAYAATKHADQVRSDKIDELTVLALKTYDTGDLAGRREAVRRIGEWNEKMKAEGKPHMLINLKDVMRRVKARWRENRVTPKTVRERERTQAVWG